MGYPTKVQQIRRKKTADQYYINFPTARKAKVFILLILSSSFMVAPRLGGGLDFKKVLADLPAFRTHYSCRCR